MYSLASPKVGVRVFDGLEFSKVSPAPVRSTSISFIKAFLRGTQGSYSAPIAAMEDMKKPKKKRKAQPRKKRKFINENEEGIPDIEDIFSDKETQKIRESLLDWVGGGREKSLFGRDQRLESWCRPLGAKMIIAMGDGFPNTVSSLRKVPGIGDYTAGAIASIAFKEVVPVVDGNVIRVLARLKAISTNPKDSMTIKNFWKLAAQLVDLAVLGISISLLWNSVQLFALHRTQTALYVLFPANVVHFQFSSRISRLVTDYPTKVVKVKQRHEFSAVCVLEILGSQGPIEGEQSDSGFALVKRPDGGLLAGLWEFPTVMLGKETDLSQGERN
ncbi:hypothetical protein GH714_029497 [Hevea brasiliensis]|uniref:Adenine DNA glycosylase n=1 Tax=Hevea brasiliensis TaxID=3981 RepID=A0A6A6K879_HEVBR|nr:hypothetical protein GH714_029497 [Hevea brasiliensis]